MQSLKHFVLYACSFLTCGGYGFESSHHDGQPQPAAPAQAKNLDLPVLSVPSTNTQWVDKPAIVNKVNGAAMQLSIPASKQ